MTRNMLVLSAIVCALQLGCDPSEPAASTPAAMVEAAAATQPVESAECIICVGHTIQVKATTPRTDYEGKTYYFCSKGCKEKFLEAPADHVHASTGTAATKPG